jgi:uncharacterized protein DUF3592
MRMTTRADPLIDRIKRYRWLWLGLVSLGLGVVVMSNFEGIQAGLDNLAGPNAQCSWPTVKGSIAGSELENHIHPNGEDDWGFTVSFTYEIEGAHYSASQWLRDFLVAPPDVPEFAEVPYLFQACADSRDMTEAVALFRAAHDKSEFLSSRPVVVYFNPANKNEAVLVPGLVGDAPMSYGEVIVLYGDLFLCLGGAIMLIVGVVNLRKPLASRAGFVPPRS